MPPKTSNEDVNGDGPVPKATDFITLLKIIETCDTLNIDSKVAGGKIQILPKNVPRKINQMVNPFGFEFKNGRILSRQGGDAAVPPTPTPTTATHEDSGPQTPTSSKKATPRKASTTATTPKSAKTPRQNKKRKTDLNEDEPVTDHGHITTEIDANGIVEGAEGIEDKQDAEM